MKGLKIRPVSKKKNPKQYFINDEVLSLIWIALFESGNEELATTLSDSMIAQGCQELSNTNDLRLIMSFWKDFLEKKGLIEFKKEMH